jgi:HlyD family secretion protein
VADKAGDKPGAAATPAPEARKREGGGGGSGAGGGMRAFLQNLPAEQREKLRSINAELGIDYRQGPPTPEQREQLRKLMVERGVITAEQAAEFAGRSGGAGGETVYVNRTVYRLPGGNKTARPEGVSVKVGITDGLASEVAAGLNEGDVLVTSVNLPNAKPGAPATNPFGGGQRRF